MRRVTLLGSILQREHEISRSTAVPAQPLNVDNLPERDLHDVLALEPCEQQGGRMRVSSSCTSCSECNRWMELSDNIPDWISIRLFVIL